jgi:hypothetical protein
MGKRTLNNKAEIRMNIGVKLGSQVVDARGVPSDIVKNGGSLRVKAVNIGIITYLADMCTEAFSNGAVTNAAGETKWHETLIIPAYGPGDQRDTRLEVHEARSPVVFRTEGHLRCLGSGDSSLGDGRGYYQSEALEVSARTA